MKSMTRLLCLLVVMLHLGSVYAASASVAFLHDHGCVPAVANDGLQPGTHDLSSTDDHSPVCSPPACTPSHAQCGVPMLESAVANGFKDHFELAVAHLSRSRVIPVEPHPPR